MSRAAAPAGAALVGAVLLSSPAAAHTALPGAGAFVNGLLHPVVVPAHLLTLVGAGLWLGRRHLARAVRALLAFAILLALGLTAAPWAPWPRWHETGLLVLALLAGGLTAADVAAGRRTGLQLLAAVALLVGLDSAPEGATLSSRALAAAGTWLGAGLLLLTVAGAASLARQPWLAIAVRVAGSWVCAIALIVLALTLRG